MKRIIWVLFGIVIIAAIIFLLSNKDKEKVTQSKQLNIGLVTWPGFGPLFIAEQKGFFKENGVKINYTIIEDEAARRSAFASGQLDIAVNTVDALASGAPKGINGIIFLKTDDSYGADGIIAKNNINSISQLKGKKVAYPKGLPSNYFLYEILKDNNMSLDDIKSVYMEASDAGAAFAAGKLDAAVTWEPWLSQGTSVGHILTTTKDKPGLIADVLMINPDIIKNNRAEIISFLKAWFKGLNYMQSNHDEATKIISDALKLPLQDTEGLMTLVKFADLKENNSFFNDPNYANNCSNLFTKASELWYKEKIIDKISDPKVHCNGELISEILGK